MTTPLIGVGISTSAAPGCDPIAEARDAERLGFDFVSASDHPGAAEPSFEAWTLLTWVAAATSRIGVLPRVLGVPFRVPAVVAKAAESLDRLAGGRLMLGLGAGYDDEEMRSLGLPDRTAGEKLRGLADAIEITRGMWREPAFTYHGIIYRTDAAQLAPKPERPIPIWLGTYGPRALELTGRLADGWIPSRGYRPDDELPLMRLRVLDAAERHGRDPDAITCALNLRVRIQDDSAGDDPFAGPAGLIVENLQGYLDAGFTAFNLLVGGDDAGEQRERLATDVLPQLRSDGSQRADQDQ